VQTQKQETLTLPQPRPHEVRASAERLSVVQVIINLVPGGAEYLLVEIATRLASRTRTVVCCIEDTGALEPELTGRGIEVIALHRKPGFRPSLSRQIAAIAARHEASVLHCHHYSPFVYGRLATLFRPGLRVIFTEHGRRSTEEAPSRKRRLANPILGRLPGAEIYAVSDALRQHMITEGFPANRVGVIHNGIEPGPRTTEADRRLARRLLGIDGDALVIGTAARLDPVKDLDTLISAFAQVRRQYPRAMLAIVGDGPERTRLEEQARRANLAEAVCFTGYRRDARRYLPGFDLYVNSSMYEGVSLTILEAMAASLPLVATRVGGTPEVVVDGQTGVLVPARDSAAMAAAITALVTHPDRMTAMGTSGRRRLERHFTIDRMVNDYLRAYRGSS